MLQVRWTACHGRNSPGELAWPGTRPNCSRFCLGFCRSVTATMTSLLALA